MKKNIYILSASDRYNYGDLLFPLIAINELSKLGNYKFHNIATTKSNLSSIGALPTKNYKTLYKTKSKDNVLLIAGGQVLGANWSGLLRFIYPLYYIAFSHLKNYRYHLEIATKFITGNKNNPLPFTPIDPRIKASYSYVYHAVGGSGISGLALKNEIRKIFDHSIYISLREKSQHDIIENLEVQKAKLTPDSAILMSNWYKFDKLEITKYQ